MRDIVRLKTERELVRIKIHDGNAFWNEIGVNAGVSKLMLLSLNLLLPVLVYAARHSLTAVRHKLMLPGITSYCWFAETHKLVAFLEKPEESDGFEGIIEFLNASSIRYALTVNSTIYTTCIEQFWSTAKVKTVNKERQIQALVDKKKVIITETSIRSDLKLEDVEGTNCLPTATIFAELERMGAKTTAWNEFSSTMASAIICLAKKKINFSKYIFDNMVKNLEGGVKFLMYPRFVQVFIDNQVEGMTKHKGINVTPSHTKKVFANRKREGKGFSGKVTPLFQTIMVQAPEDMGKDSAAPTDSHSTPIITQLSSSKPQKKKYRRKQKKDSGPTEPIPDEATNKEHVSTPSYDPPQSEKANTAQAKEIASLKKRVNQLEKRKKSRTSRLKRLRKVGSASRVESSNDVSLGAQEERNDEDILFDVQDDLQGKEFVAEKEVSAVDPVTTVGEVVTTANVEVTTASAPTKTIDELTMAQTLIEIKAAKLKAITTAVTTTTTIRPKAGGVVVQEPSEFKTTSSPSQASQLPQAKDKGKAIMDKEAQAIIEANRLLAERLQTREQEELTDEEKARLFVDLLEKRKKHFVALRAKEKRNKPPTKAQKKSTISTYLKHMEGSNKAKAYTAQESSSKRAGDELEQEKAKKQKGDDDQEEEEIK
ncbi:hypothetical protein Tco_0209420 [Tanacetum coccineum]